MNYKLIFYFNTNFARHKKHITLTKGKFNLFQKIANIKRLLAKFI